MYYAKRFFFKKDANKAELVRKEMQQADDIMKFHRSSAPLIRQEKFYGIQKNKYPKRNEVDEKDVQLK